MKQLFSSLGIPIRSVYKVLGVLYFPWVVLLLLGFFIIPDGLNYIKEVLGFFLFSTLFFVAYLTANHSRLRQVIATLGVLVLGFFCFSKLSFYMHYGTKLSVSALFVIFETNQTEAADFLSNYFSWQVLALAVLFMAYGFFAIRFFTRFFKYKKQQGAVIIVRSLVLLVTLAAVLYGIHWKFQEENIPLTVASSWGEYKTAKQQLKQQLASTNGADYQVETIHKNPETIIVVLGESTSRRNMSLYGYNSVTNPLLEKRKANLLVFDSVISPHVHTILSVDKILTLKTFNKDKLKQNVSVVQLANQAGFQTYWISGQRPVGINESVPTIIGSAAKHKYFLNTDDYKDIFYDERLLESINLALNSEATRKVIFVHLMGTHVGYTKRYPKEFSFFSEDVNSKKQLYKNQYDNAVRYNDYVLDQIITKLQDVAQPTSLVYLSDHGDDVYMEQDAIGHNEYRPTRPMYQVPFILWSNKSINNQNKTKRYSLEDFPHTFAQLCAFTFKGFDPTRSVLDSSFTMRKRIIKDSIDYDSNW